MRVARACIRQPAVKGQGQGGWLAAARLAATRRRRATAVAAAVRAAWAARAPPLAPLPWVLREPWASHAALASPAPWPCPNPAAHLRTHEQAKDGCNVVGLRCASFLQPLQPPGAPLVLPLPLRKACDLTKRSNTPMRHRCIGSNSGGPWRAADTRVPLCPACFQLCEAGAHFD